MAEAQGGIGESTVPERNNMTAGENLDMSFGSNSPARRENTIGQEQQPKEGTIDKVKKFLGIGQKPQA